MILLSAHTHTHTRESRESERPVTLTGRHGDKRGGGAVAGGEETTTLEALREDITLSFEDSHMYERSAAASAPPHGRMRAQPQMD